MEILDAIRRIDTGRQVWPLRPLKMVSIKEIEDMSNAPIDCEYIVRYELRLGCNVMVNAKQQRNDDYMHYNQKKMTAMFADTLYREVCDELREILVYTYENYGDRELGDMLNNLLNRLRP